MLWCRHGTDKNILRPGLVSDLRGRAPVYQGHKAHQHIATGTIPKIVDRASAALEAPYQKIADTARSADANYIDETSWFKEHDDKTDAGCVPRPPSRCWWS